MNNELQNLLKNHNFVKMKKNKNNDQQKYCDGV
jgi:hypothetical protein